MLSKRIICLILSLIFMLSIGGVYAAEVTESASEDATVSTTADEVEITLAASVALGLGVIEEYIPEKPVTVGEFTKFVDILASGYRLSQKYFKESHYGNEIKRITAIATMCDVLGYSLFFSGSDISSANTDEIIQVASRYKINKGMVADYQGTLTMREAVELLYNTLTAETFDVTYRQAGSIDVKVNKQNYMERVLDMYIISGIVESTSFSSIISEDGTKDYVVINGTYYLADQGAFEDYIGKNVKALIKYDNSGEGTVLSMYDKSTDILEISARDLCFDDITEDTICYWTYNGKRFAYLSPTADVLYNYSLLMGYTADDLRINQGRLVLIDNNSDGKFEVVKIEEYKCMYVFSVSMDSEIIADVFGNSVSISDLIKFHYPVMKDGSRILPENIPTDVIATYYLNKNNEVTRIYLSSEVAAGTVNNIDKSENIITLEGKEYYYTYEIEDEIEKLDTGYLLTVRLNHYGEIAQFEISSDGYLYGYLISFDEGEGVSNPKLKVFTQTNEIKIYSTADNITLNGVRMEAKDAFAYNLTTGLWDEIGKTSQIIKYKSNSQGEITVLNTATNKYDGNDHRLLKEKDGTYTYYSTPNTICGDTRLNINTKVFLIPEDLSYKKRFQYGTYVLLKNDTRYTAQVYDIDENRYAGVVVVRVSNVGTNQIDEISGSTYLIYKVGKFIADDGEPSTFVVARVMGANEETFVELKFNRNDISSTLQSVTATVADLKPGDVIQAANDVVNTKEYSTMILRYKRGETIPYETPKQQWYQASTVDTFISDGNTYAAGVIKKIVKNGFMVNNKPDTDEYGPAWDRIVTATGVTPVYICEKNGERIYKGSIGDLRVGDQVFILFRQALPKEIVIYR